ncbi:MAG TPA: hypothetical protein VFV92_00475, partial [Candidatus Bathyarchaeia archaeon]|nr:hypothetical protein [Candidatus Bathyarchaeia archaeon]
RTVVNIPVALVWQQKTANTVFTLLTQLSPSRTVALSMEWVSRPEEHSMRKRITYKDDLKKALEQADLKDVTVSENQDKNTITLGETVHSTDAKAKAADVAKAAANTRIIANEISVQPVGSGSQDEDIASNFPNERQHAQKLAAGIPNVQQVLNQIEVQR